MNELAEAYRTFGEWVQLFDPDGDLGLLDLIKIYYQKHGNEGQGGFVTNFGQGFKEPFGGADVSAETIRNIKWRQRDR